LHQTGTAITQVQGTMDDVRGHLDAALDTATSTMKNVNGAVQDVRSGKGPVGVLLEDEGTAADLRKSVANVRETTEKLNNSSARIDGILSDVQSRQLVGKMDDTLTNANSATRNLNETSQQINTTLKSAFAQNQYGEDAGSNLQQSLTNINQATGNIADDTEALKHNLFFKGFFKRRGYEDLDDLPVVQYRAGQIFKGLPESRQWMQASSLFTSNGAGEEVLSEQGRHTIDEAVGQLNGIYGQPLIIEGYSTVGSASDQLIQSRRRATLVRTYLQLRFNVLPKNTGIVALDGHPPQNAGKSTFDGVSLVSVGHRPNGPRK
jgi:phospholipid/cholesterol/gamma-HCH transport system substrate-binding protein